MRKFKEPKIEALKREIRWRGVVRLHQLAEDDPSLLAEIEYPPGSGRQVYICATSALMFCKETGRCLQSGNVELRIDSLAPASPRDMASYTASRKKMDYGRNSRDIIIE